MLNVLGPVDPEPPTAHDRRAPLREGFPLMVAAVAFVGLGVVAASRGVDVGPDRIHLSILLYALAAVAAVGAIAVGLSFTEDEPEDRAGGPETASSGVPEDLGRPPPLVVRADPPKVAAAPWSEDEETPAPERARRDRTTDGPSDEVDRALKELDTIRSALDRRPPR